MILNFQGTALKKSEHTEVGTGNYAIKLKLVDNPQNGIVLVVPRGFELNAVRIQFTSAKYHNPYGDWTDFNAGQLTDLNSAEPWISPWCDELVLYFSADPYARFMITANGTGAWETSFGRTEVAIYEVETGGTETKLQANNETDHDYMIITDISYTDTTVLLEVRQ